MRKKSLEISLQGIERYVPEHPALEQYETPANIAADLLFFAYSMGDIEGKRVCDLGCGSGIFAIGSKLLGASEVFGIDISKKAVEVAKRNAESLGVDANFLEGDVKTFNIPCDTVIQNPPFGAQKRHADRPFLEKAMEIADVIYTMHLEKSAPFVEEFISSRGGEISHKFTYEFPIKRTFSFHRKEVMKFRVNAFRVKVIR